MEVKLIEHVGDDSGIVRAARVSTVGRESIDSETREGLIRYLVREKHFSCLEHNSMTFFIEAPIFVAREFMRHRTMCISGDTEITFSSGKPQGKSGDISMRKKTIAQHWEHFNLGVLDTLGRRRILPSVKNATVVSYNEDTGEREFSKVLDVVKSGVKPVYKMVTGSGKYVKASEDHKFLTAQGWKQLKDITTHDALVAQKRTYPRDPEQRKVPWSLRTAINTWTSQQKPYIYEEFEGRCNTCGIEVTLEDSRCDHVVPVAADLEKALSISNLQLLCITCDRSKTTEEQSLRDVGHMKPNPFGHDPVVSIDLVGDEETYDLVLEGPHHNFLGNGIVTHNSYNETSGRYKELSDHFYYPPKDRPLVQKGKAADYDLYPGSADHRFTVSIHTKQAYYAAWTAYKNMLDAGIAREVARNVLPVGIYTQFYATTNLRNLMQFLDLRTADDALWEIRYIANEMKRLAEPLFPIAMEAWNDYKA